MANVYVGFRYVPLFCGVWDNSKGYEALSVVTHKGGGYTSNKPVPAGIEPGTDNGEYWAYTYRAGGEASAIDWDNVQNKPSTYPTTWEKVDGKPNVFPTNWENVEDIPANFPTTWENVGGKPTSFPTTWGSVEGKPQTFPPSTHTHEISQIDGLTDELETIGDSLNSINNALNSYDGEFSALEEELTNDISGLTGTLQTVNNSIDSINTNITSITNTLGDKMNSPTNNGSSTSYFLRWSNANQGTWATLPTASASRAGTMSSAHYTQVNNTKRYVTNEGKSGIFNFRYWSDGFVELWAKVEVSNLSVSTTLGNMYRSNSPFTDAQYKYPYTFYPQPFVYTQFFTSNNASAFVWLNPSWGRATQYLPPLYLVRPTTGTCSGYVYYYICGDTQ